ncbi:Lanthionine biosynthesis protein LanM [Fulvivirga imtechensis AK7]|uniref:Lanthionine biosynthesis protein LanM n=1 Tax=Fulvivirga imtechensis AK7 TaxID=1237149 RepID=L8JK93_9BACT|nr:lanthionine synthetase LanC family protein [Fulvivirga imtechensis]ELR69220.1 Lanthionine biosynthesis protein LanM [Fulvivirga imtechensis AK7]
MNQKYLQGAIAIGDSLLAKAHKNEDGYWWETMSLGADSQAEWHISESLYSGVAGIVYFFMELHKRTNDPKYREAMVEGARWLDKYCTDNKTSYYAFYTGRMGVAYLMLQLAEYFKDDTYKEKALQIVENCESFLEGDRLIDDLINGSSGAILGLLHLHAATGSEKILKKIEHFTEHLLSRAHFGKQGLYWDRSSNNITGLCGFSHGASGIGYVFLELGHYFGNQTFYWIAEQAFAYENHVYNAEYENWPDFRKGIYDEKSFKEHREQYVNGNKGFFFAAGDMSAWCHGAPGIGLSRVRAYELLKKDQYLQDLYKALSKTTKVSVDLEELNVPYVLCHGGGGNAILFLEAARVLGKPDYYQSAIKVADHALRYKEQNNIYISGYSGLRGDVSLFMGDAGIGYFYLLLADEALSGPSILKPDIAAVYQGPKEGLLDMNDSKLYQIFAEKLYPKTCEYLRSHELMEADMILSDNIVATIKADLNKAVETANNPQLTHIWRYENMKIDIDNAVASHSYNHIKRVVEVERNRALLDDGQSFLGATVMLPEGCVLTVAPLQAKQEEEDEEENYTILLPASEGLLEFPLNYFSYAVIQKFEQPKRVEEGMNEMIEEFEVSNESEIQQVKMATLNQIKEAMKQGILQLDHSAVANVDIK